MTKYVLEEGKGVVKEEEEEEYVRRRTKPRRVLSDAMKGAWMHKEMDEVKDDLSDVARKWWVHQIEEALKTTKYAEELKARAREIDYSAKVKKVWGK